MEFVDPIHLKNYCNNPNKKEISLQRYFFFYTEKNQKENLLHIQNTHDIIQEKGEIAMETYILIMLTTIFIPLVMWRYRSVIYKKSTRRYQ